MTSPEDPQFPNEVNIDEEIAPPPHFVQLQSGINYEPVCTIIISLIAH